MELSAAPCALASLLLPGCTILQRDSLASAGAPIDGKIPAIIGNPPYSGHSTPKKTVSGRESHVLERDIFLSDTSGQPPLGANNGSVRELLADYRVGLHEKNSKWWQDDYVKFIRYAQQSPRRAPGGCVVAFITNHSYIDLTFRRMRASLMETFDEICVLDLHGNSKTFDRGRRAQGDENSFRIQMGVGITLMRRHRTLPPAGCGMPQSAGKPRIEARQPGRHGSFDHALARDQPPRAVFCVHPMRAEPARGV